MLRNNQNCSTYQIDACLKAVLTNQIIDSAGNIILLTHPKLITNVFYKSFYQSSVLQFQYNHTIFQYDHFKKIGSRMLDVFRAPEPKLVTGQPLPNQRSTDRNSLEKVWLYNVPFSFQFLNFFVRILSQICSKNFFDFFQFFYFQ